MVPEAPPLTARGPITAHCTACARDCTCTPACVGPTVDAVAPAQSPGAVARSSGAGPLDAPLQPLPHAPVPRCAGLHMHRPFAVRGTWGHFVRSAQQATASFTTATREGGAGHCALRRQRVVVVFCVEIEGHRHCVQVQLFCPMW